MSYRLQGSKSGKIVLDVVIDVGLATHAFRRATEIVLAYSDLGDHPVDLWTLARCDD